jgi:hypothetical protein
LYATVVSLSPSPFFFLFYLYVLLFICLLFDLLVLHFLNDPPNYLSSPSRILQNKKGLESENQMKKDTITESLNTDSMISKFRKKKIE